MEIINPKPYSPIEDKNFTEAIIDLRNKEFKGVSYINGRIPLVFKNCLFKKLTIQNSKNIKFEEVSLMFTNCYIERLEVENITSENISFIFHSSILSLRVSSATLKAISINNCILLSNATITDVKNIWLRYTTENIYLRPWIRLFKKLDIGDFRELIKEKQYYNIQNVLNININSNKKDSDVVGKYLIDYNKNLENRYGYRLLKEEEELLKIQLSINYNDESLDEKTEIENVDLYSLSISGKPIGKFEINNTKICSWYMSEFSPKGEVKFYDINPINYFDEDSKISIHKSNLDNVWFDNVHFDGYDKLSFYRTIFSKTIFTSCDFPDRYEKFLPLENIHYPERKGSNYHKDQYEIFLQLKKALETTGNNHEALKLHAVSHDALRKIESISFLDSLILLINAWSNDHGMSIKRPFLGFLMCSVLLYILYLSFLGRILNGNEVDWDLFGYYFSFIDLTHRTDFLVGKEEYNFFSLFIDYFGKILTSFFIFQLVSAFRKYGKK